MFLSITDRQLYCFTLMFNKHPYRDKMIQRKAHVRYLIKALRKQYHNLFHTTDSWLFYWLHMSLSLLSYSVHHDYIFISKQRLLHSPLDLYDITTFYVQTVVVLEHLTQSEFLLLKAKATDLIALMNTEKPPITKRIDLRAMSCAAILSKIFDINLVFDTDYVISCQTYEGGFGCSPTGEAHAGFTYCAVLYLALCDGLRLCDMSTLKLWLMCRVTEMNSKCGKVSDSCYAYWLGATLKILADKKLVCAQFCDMAYASLKSKLMEFEDRNGGFKGKMNETANVQHLCYALFYLSLIGEFSVTIDPLVGILKECKVSGVSNLM